MPMIHVYVDQTTLNRLERASEQLGRPILDLAEAAVAEAALEYDRKYPVEKPKRGPTLFERMRDVARQAAHPEAEG